MEVKGKATRIELLNFRSVHTRVFHITWFSFFLCFFGWFGIAPLMAVVREEFALTKTQVGNIIIASVLVTVFARVLIGWFCERFGPRKTYTGLLILGSIPVMCIGFAHDYTTFLLARLAIGVVGASFVITQYHTSVMFAPNVVGTANATSAGWGNLGGGVTQMVMPLVFAGLLSLGLSESVGWRAAMVVPGAAMFIMGLIYYRFTTDYPEGNKDSLDIATDDGKAKPKGSVLSALNDVRVWALFIIYGACFGIELTINNVAALYYHDRFALDVKTAGLIAGLFGLMNIFARTLGGFAGDRFGIKFGLKGRVWFLGGILLLQGCALMLFSRMGMLPLAIVTMIAFSLCVQMAEGATFSVVPFINKESLGLVAGIVGAGGNVGAVAAGFLFRSENIAPQDALLYLGIAVACVSTLTLLVRFSPEVEERERLAVERALVLNRSSST